MSERFWVFAYGSLMWRPGFAFDEAQPATLTGYARAFCVYSTHHRGTERKPGLVLGLDRGGVCHGRAYRVPDDQAGAVHDYLRAREQVNGVYRERRVPVDLDDGSGRRVRALTYIVERAHPGYAGRLPVQRQADIIRGARGLSGPNIDYLANAIEELGEAGAGADQRALQSILSLIHPFFRRAARNGSAPSPVARALVAAEQRRAPLVRQPKRLERRRFLYRMNCERLSTG
ncbi:MAG: gamma-glutamylcyclotransferase [Pseudomonadota bacterium]